MYVDLERFLDAVARLMELWRRGLLHFDGARLVLDDAAGDDRPAPGGGLYMDLGDAISAVSSGASVDEFVAARQEPRPSFEGVEEPDVARAKYEAVRELVDQAGLRASMELISTAKLPVLSAHTWEVVTRVADSSGRSSGQPVRYAVLRLASEQALRPAAQTSSEVFVALLDENRVEALINDLARLRDALTIERSAARARHSKDGEQNG